MTSNQNSGCVLLNNKHRVIDITYVNHDSIEAQNINYAINVNYLEKMYDKLIKNETFDLPNKLYSINNIESFVQIAPSKIYYSVDNLEKFYNSTSAKKIFENSLKEQDINILQFQLPLLFRHFVFYKLIFLHVEICQNL